MVADFSMHPVLADFSMHPELKHLQTNVSLKESDAWPAEVLLLRTVVSGFLNEFLNFTSFFFFFFTFS